MNPATNSARQFSPWLDQQRRCATCTHSLGFDGSHLWCQLHRMVVVTPCGAWERGPGTDDANR